MSQARTVVLDNEAVQALADPSHRRHRRVVAVVEAVAARNLRRAGSVRLLVPTSVRVEAGWSRQASTGVALNRLRVADDPLDGGTADRAARVRSALGVSVADAHLAATLAAAGPHAVLTGDTDDMGRIAEHLGLRLTVVAV
jgi:predicted nucleic acid-binding protein